MLRLTLRPLQRLAAAALKPRPSFTLIGRPLSTTPRLLDTFTVQDEDDFQARVLDNPEPVIVDFNAEWCGPCKMLSPRLDAAIAAAEGQVHLALVDIDELGDLAIEHGVQAVPTVLALKQGKEVDRFVGLLDEDKLSAFVNRLRPAGGANKDDDE